MYANTVRKAIVCGLLLAPPLAMIYASETPQVTKTVGECTGQVIDSDGEPAIGVSVFVVNSDKGTSTDIDGRFAIKGLKPGAVLRISGVGYTSTQVTWEGRPITVTLENQANALDEVVVVGYGVQKKVNLTGAVSTVNGDVLKDRPITNIGQGLQGVIGNLNITPNNGGAPGATSSFNVRGTTSINGGGPLILVDNVQMDPNLINPNDIESVTVLKDAASAAIYGARAAYGVVLITTKKGQVDRKPVISIGASGYWSQAAMAFHSVNSLDYVNMMNYANTSDGGGNYFDEQKVQHVEDYFYGRYELPVYIGTSSSKYEYCGNTDWWDESYKTAFSQLYNVSISGGSNKSTYYASLAMTDQGTNRVGADEDYKRYNMAINFDTQLSSWLKVGGKISNAYTTQKHPTGSPNAAFTAFSGSFTNTNWPLMPVYHPDGNFAGQGNWTNPVAVAKLGGNTRMRTIDFWTTGMVQLTPIKGLFIQGDYTWNVYAGRTHYHQEKFMEYGIDGQPLAYYPWTNPNYNQYSNSQDFYQAFNAFAQYDFQLGGSHNFKVMTGYNQEKKVTGSDWIKRAYLFTNSSNMIDEATGDLTGNSAASQWSINSWFGRINYDFEGKYLLELVARYDGSSRFPKGRKNRYGFFPSGSIGWRISQENFWESVRGWWNNMKIRASYGRLGNQAVSSDFPYLANYGMNSTYGFLLGGNKIPAVTAPGLVSSTLTWEKVDQLDLGFDAAFFNNRLTAEFDWYKRQTKDMLTGGRTLPAVLGTGVPSENAADLSTTGWELTVRWNDRIDNIGLGYYVRLALSDYQSKITKIANETGYIYSYYNGYKIGQIWGYHSNGLFQNEEEIASAPSQSAIYGGKWTPGMTRYEDLDNDGKIGYGENTLENHGDLSIIGNSTPRYAFGIIVGADWKGFDFEMFWQGIAKRDYMFSSSSTDFWAFDSEWAVPQSRIVGKYWTPETTDAYYPKLSLNSSVNRASRQNSTRYIQNASYGRLKNLMIGYTIPTNITSRIGIDKVRVYLQGENLLTITPMERCVDPETLYNRNYPPQRKYTVGINVTL